MYNDQHAGEPQSRFKQSAARDEERDTPPRRTPDDLHVLGSGGTAISAGSSKSGTAPLSLPLSSRSSVSRSTSPGRLPPVSGPGTSDVRSTASAAWEVTGSGSSVDFSAGDFASSGSVYGGGNGLDQGSISVSGSAAFSAMDFGGGFGPSPSFPSLSSASSVTSGGVVHQTSIHPMLQDTDVAMDNVKPNEEAVWQNFLHDLGIST